MGCFSPLEVELLNCLSDEIFAVPEELQSMWVTINEEKAGGERAGCWSYAQGHIFMLLDNRVFLFCSRLCAGADCPCSCFCWCLGPHSTIRVHTAGDGGPSCSWRAHCWLGGLPQTLSKAVAAFLSGVVIVLVLAQEENACAKAVPRKCKHRACWSPARDLKPGEPYWWFLPLKCVVKQSVSIV